MSNNSVATAPTAQVVDGSFFSDLARDYSSCAALTDAIIKSENPESDVATAHDVIERLRLMAASGKGYTPDKSLGFGSDNGATIAEKILGLAPTTSQVRKLLKAAGKR